MIALVRCEHDGQVRITLRSAIAQILAGRNVGCGAFSILALRPRQMCRVRQAARVEHHRTLNVPTISVANIDAVTPSQTRGPSAADRSGASRSSSPSLRVLKPPATEPPRGGRISEIRRPEPRDRRGRRARSPPTTRAPPTRGWPPRLSRGPQASAIRSAR
jgi:hypothetical protein